MRTRLASAILLLSAPAALATPAIDGFNSSTSALVSQAQTVTITTASTNEVIILFAAAGLTGTGAGAVTGVTDTAGLTWHLRKAVDNTSNTLNSYEEWYAVSPGTLSADTVTVQFNSFVGSARSTVFGVSGANSASPFDANAAVPASQNNTTGVTAASTTVSTNNANDLLVTSIRSGSSGLGTVTRPGGFTSAGSAGTGEDVAYENVSTTQSSLALNYSYTTSNPTVMISDAIQAAPSATHNLLLDTAF